MMRCLLLGLVGSTVGLNADSATVSQARDYRLGWLLSLWIVGSIWFVGLPSSTAVARDDDAAEVADEDIDEDAEGEEVADVGGEEMPLKTKDGLRMSCRFYPGSIEDKETIPVVLLHGWKGQGSDFDSLAKYLQSEDGGAHSVIVPDLRGHGGSTELKPEGSEKSKELNANRMSKAEFQQMLKFELESVKKVLMEKHNEGALNIDALTVVGADMGAILSLYWAARDWSWKPLAGIKQGQDVKAVVLLSAPVSFKGITPQVALKQTDLRDSVSLLMLYGRNDTKATSAATRLHNTVKRHRKQDWDSPEEKRKKQDLFLIGLDTSLQAADLLTEDELPTKRYIGQFIEGRVRSRMEEDFPWKARRRADE